MVTSRTNAPARSAPWTLAGVTISCPPTSFTANTTNVTNNTTVNTACIRWMTS